MSMHFPSHQLGAVYEAFLHLQWPWHP